MALTSKFSKYAISNLDYQWDYSEWLETTETIVSASVVADTGIDLGTVTNTTTTVTAWLSGGTAQTTYEISCQIQTTLGRIDKRLIEITIL